MEPGIDETVSVFYRTERAGACRLSDGGGPFGSDITVAVVAGDLIVRYGCDAVAETGCFLGDTTAYLARRYPGLPVYSCDTDPGCAAFTERRLRDCPNTVITCEDSPQMLARVGGQHARVLAFLDAHWGQRWPLPDELEALASAVVMIHDFDIGHARFSFDTYNGTTCDPGVLVAMTRPPDRYFTLRPDAAWPVPCLQTGRRAGVGVITIGLDPGPLDACLYLARHGLSAAAAGRPQPAQMLR
jgi:hypothetical protein